VLKYAVRHDILTVNPADRVELGGRSTVSEEFEGRALSPEEVVAIVGEVQNVYPVYALTVLFLAYTGLRAGELAGLNVGDLTLTTDETGEPAGAVRVERTRRKVKGGWETGTPKSRNSRRTVPLDSWLAGALDVYLRTTHPRGSEPDAPLFPHRHHGRRQTADSKLDWNQPIEPNAFYKNVFIPAVARAGLPPTRLHDLRHTFATLQLRNGPPDHYMQVSVWLGHAEYATTLRTYAHVIPRPDAAKAYQLPAPVVAPPAEVSGGATVLQFRRRASG
jgi:integrase